jgi:hypothetical protein
MIMKRSSACNSSICIWLGSDHLTCYGFFFSLRIFFSDNMRDRIFFLLSHKARNFFPVFNIRLYNKNSESNYFFPPPNIGKLNGPSLMNDTDVERTSVLGFKFTKCFDLQRFVFLIVVKLTEEIMFN